MKVKLIALMVLSALLLSGCRETESAELSGRYFVVITDDKTGCKYITYDRGISPYYDENGRVAGCFNSKSEGVLQ
jgi:hypothetical protein